MERKISDHEATQSFQTDEQTSSMVGRAELEPREDAVAQVSNSSYIKIVILLSDFIVYISNKNLIFKRNIQITECLCIDELKYF